MNVNNIQKNCKKHEYNFHINVKAKYPAENLENSLIYHYHHGVLDLFLHKSNFIIFLSLNQFFDIFFF